MQWFIISRDMHVLCNPSTDNQNSLPLDDSGDNYGQEIAIANNVATGTYDFVTDPYHVDAVHIKLGNYVAFRDKYGRHRLYTIMNVDGEDELDVHCEDVGLDLLNEDTDVWDIPAEPIASTLNRVLFDSGWTIGVNEISDRSRATKYEGQTDTQLARVGMICNAFDAEADFEIVMDGSTVNKQVVNVYQKIGEDISKQRFVDDINLVSLRRTGSIENLCTCLRCFGKEDDNGHKIDISSIEYDDGRYFSPKGNVRIFDRKARDKWSRFRAYNFAGDTSGGGYINGTFEYDTDSPQELFNRGLANLKTRNDEEVAYEVKLIDLQADIGDTVQIADSSQSEKVYLSARVQVVRNHYTVESEDTGTLANYTILTSNPTKSVTDLMNDLKKQVVNVLPAVIAYQVGTSGVDIPTGEWLEAIPTVPAGSYLWMRTTTPYSDGSSTVGYTVSRQPIDGTDAILLNITSVNGNIFKNTGVSTTATVTIIMGDKWIDTEQKLLDQFGPEAYLQWQIKKVGEIKFTDIQRDDPRLSDGGFIFTLNVNDIDQKATLNCNLNF